MSKEVNFGLFLHLVFLVLLFEMPKANSQEVNFEFAAFADRNNLRLEVTFDNKHFEEYKFDITLAKEGASNHVFKISDLTTDSIIHSKNRGIIFIDNLNVDSWEPTSPNLYNLKLKVKLHSKVVGVSTERIGFRSFESKEGQLWLNGRPLFLKGIAINPPRRGIPSYVERSRVFAEEYIRYMKSLNVNIIRIPDDEIWYDVCDELGMMVFGGNYGKKPPLEVDEAVEWYKEEKFRPILHHPSLVIYALHNEAPYSGEAGLMWKKLLNSCYEQLKLWDSTRVYIGNAGYGYGQSGDICDLHRYWGWYYSSAYTFINIRDNEKIIPFKKGVQPITFTECVGNYTGPDGRYNLSPDHKNPVSQLCWTGHAPENLQVQYADQHHSFTLKTATELFRRMRVLNHELSGIFPFTILFKNWHNVEKFSDMGPKPVTQQVKVSYQPILLSWELWRTQIYSGSFINPIAHIINDDLKGEDLDNITLRYGIEDATANLLIEDSININKIAYYGTKEIKLSIQIPENVVGGRYNLVGEIISDSGVISSNTIEIFIANNQFVDSRDILDKQLLIFKPSLNTQDAFQKLDIPHHIITTLHDIEISGFVVLDNHSTQLLSSSDLENLSTFVSNGGRILVLKQDTLNMLKIAKITSTSISAISMDIDNATYPPPMRPSMNGFNINPERPDHPVFNGINREMLRVWSDYTNWNETKPGMPAIYPVTNGFILEDKNDVAHTAILANYSVGLEGIALAEIFKGKGSVLISGFDLLNRVGIDPVADKLFKNLICYMGSQNPHFNHLLIEAPIVWGKYESEKGLITGIYSGLMLHTSPKLTDAYKNIEVKLSDEGYQFAGGRVTWASMPGLQYIPNGRRMFGPYFHRGFGGIPEPENNNTSKGEGQFWCRVASWDDKMTTLVWNPSDEPLQFTIILNGNVKSEIYVEPKSRANSIVHFESGKDSLHVKYKGDRRLVLLETSFN